MPEPSIHENTLIATLRAQSGRLKLLFLVILAVLVVLNFFIGPYDPHVAWEVFPGFWAGFGFVLAVAMAFVMKRIIAPLIGAPEDIHD
ncbi:MAG: hypothetical protein EA399_13040 [Desulfovibrionales bacterium]|uniref:hypothetical protein n=1 Tax=Desulfonatronum thioautotrophicum TaxID=617001 RepID=UPI0005EB725B|nr:hypothetical protein [Desulfonatronum thioautotrophicum]TVQ97391.1 MAG: hypothetical protein EA399_13040 [Desulfovibrionales bacterium]